MRILFLLLSLWMLSLGCPSEEEGSENLPEHSENPSDPDADVDCDGIPDWEEERFGTNPQNHDTDGDGIWDGIEIGRSSSTDLQCENRFPRGLSSEGRTHTNPTREDTDCDGISDGGEDRNQNGRVDEGETDPAAPNNFDALTRNACTSGNWASVDIQRSVAAQIALGLPMGFANSYVNIQRGSTRGLMGLDASRNVAFVAWQHFESPVNMAMLTNLIQQHATNLSAQNVTSSPFNSWDAPSNEANAHSVTFTLSGNMSPAERIHDMARILLGFGPESLPTGGAIGATQHVRAQYVLRGNGEVVVVMAVALDNDSVNGSPGYFGLMDVAGNTALAHHLDSAEAQCEVSEVGGGAVDFLFVVDDSGSMTELQAQLAGASNAMAEALNNSALDWRVALVTSSYHLNAGANSMNAGIVRGFTRDVQELQAWLRQGSHCNATTGTCSGNPAPASAPTCGPTGFGTNSGCWIGTNGDGAEGMLGAGRLALMHMSDPTAEERIRLRNNAERVVVILSDTEDQTSGLNSSYPSSSPSPSNSWEDVQNFINFFRERSAQVNAIYCPSGTRCSASEFVPHYPDGMTRIQRVVEATGGVAMPIAPNAVSDTIAGVVNKVIGAYARFQTQKPFIGASLRVSMGNPMDSQVCNGAHVPRSRIHGFDYDGFSQTVSFYGACRPATRSRIGVSYRSWKAENHSP